MTVTRPQGRGQNPAYTPADRFDRDIPRKKEKGKWKKEDEIQTNVV
jgi:hypothetical protein